MNRGIPATWVKVDRATFERVVAKRDYRRTAYDYIFYEDLATGREFGAVKDRPGQPLDDDSEYWLRPDAV